MIYGLRVNQIQQTYAEFLLNTKIGVISYYLFLSNHLYHDQ